MKQLFLLAVLVLMLSPGYSQSLYIKTFGNKNNPPVIFIHGGPRGNSLLFEATTASQLANRGFYVIVYDRRGEGRSSYKHAKVTFQEAFNDLNDLYKKFGLQRAHIIGFSFGGLVSTLFAEQYPNKIASLTLTSGLFAQQATYDHILDSVKKIYTAKHDTTHLREVATVAQLPKNSAAYRKACYALASENGFFKVAQPTEEAEKIYAAYDALHLKDVRNDEAPLLFYKNEKRNNIDVKPVLSKLKQQQMRIYAIYGKQDVIFPTSQIDSLRHIVGDAHFQYLDQASHYLFADRQTAFLNSLEQWLKK
ncbi:MAG: alpha/beta hydrolase [Chitinophaga sp.]|uniref:alpha/beta fold hydrolase n=1 Tax=Chitinophaga sp. TaxID=1869181 RepID=UPI001B1EFA74|nr:alpha/beta hydrolase [Chitinophaga sp.]MBO9729658.1 alpha/beta hydrolase [Chitinophaga sp.]